MAESYVNIQDTSDSDYAGFMSALAEGLGIPLSVKSFGAVGDGETDDSDAIIEALYSVVETGGVLYFPAGTYNIGSTLSLSGYDGAREAFHIVGAGWKTVLNRLDGCGTVLNLRQLPDGVTVRDLWIKGNAEESTTNANHGLVMGGGNDMLALRVKVTDWKSSAIMLLSEDGTTIRNAVVDGCIAFGNGASDNGILIAGDRVANSSDIVNSGIRNCDVRDVGKGLSLSPGFGLQLKQTGVNCFISNSYIENAMSGLAFGGYGADKAIVSDCRVYDCQSAISGPCYDSLISGVVIDMNNNTANNEVIIIEGENSVYENIKILNQRDSKYHARFLATAQKNVVRISDINNSNGPAHNLAWFISGALGNHFSVDHVSSPSITSFAASGVILDEAFATSATENTWSSPVIQATRAFTIASGVVYINAATQSVNLDTESAAASDDLVTITGGALDGKLLALRTVANARDVVVKHGTGNISLVGAADFTLTTASSSLLLRYNSAVSKWCEVARATI